MSSAESRFFKLHKNSKPTNWKNFLAAANIDYISFFMQYHIGIPPVGTVLWIAQQSVEKYCKAILNKYDDEKYSEVILSRKPFGHNLINLWQEIKLYTTQFSYEKAYEDFIKELNECTTDTRYLNYNIFFNLGLIETFTVLGCEFRCEIIGIKSFMKSFFGIEDIFIPKAFLNNYNFESLFKKLMHMSLEHGISFSVSGVPDTYQWTGVDLSKATAKFCQCSLHTGLEKECPMCRKIIWQDEKRSHNDYVILKDFFRS